MRKTVGIIGLGLLGGSLAKALKAYTDYDVVGYARRQEVCDAALQDGVVSQAWTEVEPLIENSDIVVFSLPPDTNARLFTEVAHLFKPGQVVTDVSSAKENFVRAVYESIPKGTFFVSVHPMAGSEKGGYEVSHKNLFKGMGWIVLEDKASDVYNEEVAKELADMGRADGSRRGAQQPRHRGSAGHGDRRFREPRRARAPYPYQHGSRDRRGAAQA